MSDSDSANLSVVVPLFGCAGTISDLVERLFALEQSLGSIEVIIVDDHSTDGGWQIVSELAKVHHNLITIRLPRNRGQHYAVARGVCRSSGRYVATIDCDLEFEPESLVQMLRKLDNSTDCVIAESPPNQARRLGRRILGRLYHRVMASITGSDFLSSETIAYNFFVARGRVARQIFQHYPLSDPTSTKLLYSDLRLGTYSTVRMKRSTGFSGYSISENLHVTNRSILGSGRDGEIFAIRLTGFLALSSIVSGTIWLVLGFFERDSGVRDVSFILVLLTIAMFTISSTLVLAMHIMTTIIRDSRFFNIDEARQDSPPFDSDCS